MDRRKYAVNRLIFKSFRQRQSRIAPPSGFISKLASSAETMLKYANISLVLFFCIYKLTDKQNCIKLIGPDPSQYNTHNNYIYHINNIQNIIFNLVIKKPQAIND